MIELNTPNEFDRPVLRTNRFQPVACTEYLVILVDRTVSDPGNPPRHQFV